MHLLPILGIVIGEKFERLLAAAQRCTDQGHPDRRPPDLGRSADEADGAFSALWRDANPALLRYLRVIAPGAAEDIAADTWVQVVRGLATFRGDEAAWRAWLFTIARHRAIDWGRAQARRRTVPLAESDSADRLTVPDAAEAALERISTRAVLAKLSALPPDQAEIILLRVVAGLDATDVARIVGKSPGAVRVAAHRGLRRLAATADRAGVTR